MASELAPAEAGPRPLVICGPSGVGKGSLIGKLMAEHGGRCGFSVSHTTRAPRPGEVDGVHYHFVSKEAMLADVAAGARGRGRPPRRSADATPVPSRPHLPPGLFLEHAHVHGNVYGTSLAAVRRVREQGKVCVLDIDVQGARSVKRAALGAAFVFIAPPSMGALEERLRGRGTETDASARAARGGARRDWARACARVPPPAPPRAVV